MEWASILLVSLRHPASRWEAQRLSAADRLPRRENHQSLCGEHRRLPVSFDFISIHYVTKHFLLPFPLVRRGREWDSQSRLGL